MSLVGAAVTPHPPIIVPEVGRERLAEVEDTVTSMRRLGEWAAGLEPDTMVVLSPHAPLSARQMGVSLAESYRGSFAQFNAPEVSLSFAGDVPLAEAIMRESLDRKVHVQPMARTGEGFELDHGTLVPVYFLTQGMREAPKLIVLGFSLNDAAAHVSFGEAVAVAADVHPGRVLFVASGDLSHRLTPDAPAGYSPRGQDFDRRVAEAIRRGRAEDVLAIPKELVDAAGECGYRSLLVLCGVLAGRAHTTDLLSYEGPFGVGYLVGRVALEQPAGPVGSVSS